MIAKRLPIRTVDSDALPRIEQWAARCVAPLERCTIDEGRELLRGCATHCGISLPLQRLEFSAPSRLWAYEFHYRRWLVGLALLRRSGEITPEELVARWRDADESDDGALHEPYVLSRRVVCELLAIGIVGDRLPASDAEEFLNRIAAETALLSRLTEAHLAGNHELTRAAVLATADVLLLGKNTDAFGWYSALLNAQCDRDGLHEERSPAYHLIAIADLQRVIAAGEVASIDVRQLREIESRMSAAMKGLLHPDGTLPMFHDSTAIVVPAAADFGIHPDGASRDFCDSGLVSWRGTINGRDAHLIADFGSPRPSHQPGHQHAAPFAFELWWGDLLFTSAGVSTYERNDRRLFERSTAAHASVRVDSKDPAEIWASFRMGRGYDVREREVEFGQPSDETQLRVTGVHNGFGDTRPHRRLMELSGVRLLVRDVVDGHGHSDVEVFLPVASGWAVDREGDAIVCSSGDRRAVIIASAPITVSDFEVARQFGVRQPGACVVITQSGSLPIQIDTQVDFQLR